MSRPLHAPVRPLVVLHSGQSRWFPSLLTAATQHDLPLFVYAAQPGSDLGAAFQALRPLGFAGVVIEDPGLQAVALDGVVSLEAEAQQARRVDAVVPENLGPRGYYLEPVALAMLLRRHAFGERAVWVGPARAEMAQGLRYLSKVSVLSRNFPEGEGFLSLIPGPQRGVVGVAEVQSEVVARQADLVIYSGGTLPMNLLQPFHTLLALKPAPSEALRLIGEYIGPEEFQRFHLAALLEALGFPLPPESFTV
ncbi:MAG: hypothetical protein SFU83_04770 [Meiothermus sp.]|nr:hypothetical protein [Meiothermus sp.]